MKNAKQLASLSGRLHNTQQDLKRFVEDLDTPDPSVGEEVMATRILEVIKALEVVRLDIGGLIKLRTKEESNAS